MLRDKLKSKYNLMRIIKNTIYKNQHNYENTPMARVLLCQQRFLSSKQTLSLAVRNRGSSLKASLTSLLNLLNRVSNSSTYFSESCKQNKSKLALLQAAANTFLWHESTCISILLIFNDPTKWRQLQCQMTLSRGFNTIWSRQLVRKE